MREVRVRFAPSPTGALHIGGVRTALYNYLLARRHQGKMILRIEDTDQSRYVPGAERYIQESLTWAGIAFDEGPEEGGPYAPYRQSERKALYGRYAEQLVASGHAYYAFDTAEELEAMRERLKHKAGANPQYGIDTRMEMNNSLALPPEEVSRRMEAKIPYVIRLKVPEGVEIKVADLIRGEVTVHSAQIDDKVLMKSDGMPTYHLANVVDDHLMKISHVIRGEEWLPSAPLHVLIYRFLGWEEEMPAFAHLPLLLKPDGKGKLSKRDADQMGFPIFPLSWTDPKTGEVAKGFKESGYLPEALVNFLALLGWNPGTEQELFSMEELIDAFALERIGKAGAKFDIQKARWFNQHYLRAKTDRELAQFLMAGAADEGISCTEEKALPIVRSLRERVTFPSDFWEAGKIFFIAPVAFDEQIAAKKWNQEAIRVITALRDALAMPPAVTHDTAAAKLEQITAALGISQGKIMQALRLALTGGASGPDLAITMEILGHQETARRLSYALAHLEAANPHS